ncbi:MAG: alpha-E domain-containing protein [Pseudomonadales bacterium]|nr:alpha-E domain-containing protein [Pseudomonadales bacterium]MCP5185660.1 alpha-E domain-containing protein [Pseudomonadales bacterium]
MLSSLAGRLYWVGRNLERAENTARLINVYSELLLDLPKGVPVGWSNLIRITGSGKGFASHRQSSRAGGASRYMAGAVENPNSIISTVRIARENMRTLRDVVPREAFEAVNDLYLFTNRKLASTAFRPVTFPVLKEVIDRCHQISGLFSATMSRGPEHEFLMLGRYLERADMTTRIIDVAGELRDLQDEQISDHDTILWVSVLRSASAYQMYRRSVRSRVTPVRVLHFLLNDLQFPRAVRYCLHQIRYSSNRLPRPEAPIGAVDRLLGRMDGITLRQLVRSELRVALDDFQKELICIHQAIEATWFEPYDVKL